MTLKRGLLRIYWRQALPATVLGFFSMSIYALVYPDVMSWRDLLPPCMAGLQCILLAWLLGRFNTPEFAFVYSRGYCRDTLWGHMMLVSVFSALAAWLPAAMIVWSGLLSCILDKFGSPYFPIMAPLETPVPWAWLGCYLALIPICHYAWIRLAQPTRGRFGGILCAAGLVIVFLLTFDMLYFLDGWFAWMSGATFGVTLLCLVYGSRKLHRLLEVRA
jgi:hypothetical protein